MEEATIHWMLNWFIPDVDPYLIYAYKECVRWGMNNGWAILVGGNILAWMKIAAMKTESVVDDKIVSWITFIVTAPFKWIASFKKKEKGTKENPHILAEVVDEKVEVEKETVIERLNKEVTK